MNDGGCTVFDNIGRLRKDRPVTLLQLRRQLREAQLQSATICRNASLVLARQGLCLQLKRFVKRIARHGSRALYGQLDAEIALLWNALLFANQPIGTQLNLNRALIVLRLEGRAYLNGRDQQSGVFVAIVGQTANGNTARRRPNDWAIHHACGQLPLKLGGQTRIARVAPVGVPMGLVHQLQTQPNGFAGSKAIRRKCQKGGFNLRGFDHLAGRARTQNLSLCVCLERQAESQANNQANSQSNACPCLQNCLEGQKQK